MFNDLTGVSEDFTKAYDLQSKKARSNSEDIGRELVTLYKNFISELHFSDYILFLGSIKNNILNNSKLTEFKYSDFKDEEKLKVKNSLIEECKAKTYIDSEFINDLQIDKFLEKVNFVVNSRSKVEYIKSIVEVKKIIIEDKVFEDIFNSIKKCQSSKKEEKVEGLELNAIEDFKPLQRHLTKDDIKQYILNIILNYDWCSRKTIPVCLSDAFGPLTTEQSRDLQDNFLKRMSLTLYDASNNRIVGNIVETGSGTTSYTYTLDNSTLSSNEATPFALPILLTLTYTEDKSGMSANTKSSPPVTKPLAS